MLRPMEEDRKMGKLQGQLAIPQRGKWAFRNLATDNKNKIGCSDWSVRDRSAETEGCHDQSICKHLPMQSNSNGYSFTPIQAANYEQTLIASDTRMRGRWTGKVWWNAFALWASLNIILWDEGPKWRQFIQTSIRARPEYSSYLLPGQICIHRLSSSTDFTAMKCYAENSKGN